MAIVIEHFDKVVGNPNISEDYIYTSSSTNFISTPVAELLDFSKPFKFKINLSTLSESGNLTWSVTSSGSSIAGLNYYWGGSQGYMICAVGNGSSFNDIGISYTAQQQKNFILEWDGSVYTAYVEYKDGTFSNKYTLTRSTPIPNCAMYLGQYGSFISDLKEFSLEHTDGTYSFKLVEIKEPSTIQSKLIQLAETKNLIKNAIISKGGVVTDSTPFRDYADIIRNL